MGRTTSTQRGASRRTASTTASRGGAARRGSASARTSSARTSSAKRGSKSPARTGAKVRRTPAAGRVRLQPAGPWMPVAAIVLVVVLGWSLYPALKLQYQTSRRAAGLEQQYESLRKRNAALSAEVAALKTPEGVEKAAREKLGYAKSGENVYVVIPDGSKGASDVTTASMAGGSGTSLIQSILDVIFGVSTPSAPVVEP